MAPPSMLAPSLDMLFWGIPNTIGGQRADRNHCSAATTLQLRKWERAGVGDFIIAIGINYINDNSRVS